MTPIEAVRRMAANLHARLEREKMHAVADTLLCRKIKKGEQVLKEGEICHGMFFIEKGMMRQYYFKYGKDLTEHISYEDGFVICLESYLKEEPTRLIIETLENCIAWEIRKDLIERLAEEDAKIGVFYRKIFENSLIDSQVKADVLRFEPAQERYARLLQLHPEILKRAPLVYVASFLQMTPETLSRVRSSYHA